MTEPCLHTLCLLTPCLRVIYPPPTSVTTSSRSPSLQHRVACCARGRLRDSASTATCGCVTPSSPSSSATVAAVGDFARLAVDLNLHPSHSLRASAAPVRRGRTRCGTAARRAAGIRRTAACRPPACWSSRESCRRRPGRCWLRRRRRCCSANWKLAVPRGMSTEPVTIR